MKLYHGTTEAVARAAFDRGLAPRARTGAEGNWELNPSAPDLVYLTTAYAGYFAGCAASDGERWGIVEVDATDLVTSCFRPDEDFIEQASRKEGPIPGRIEGMKARIEGMKARTEWVRERLDNFAHHWRDSLDGLGNCAYVGEVPGIAVARVAIFDPASNPVVAMAAMDPTITVLNFAFMRHKYAGLIRWLMGEEITPDEFGVGVTGGLGLTPDQEEAARAKLPPEMLAAATKRAEVVGRELAKRDGLTVLEPVNRIERTSCCEAIVAQGLDGMATCSACGAREDDESLDPPEGG